jgi:hypothetical protein
MASLNFPHNHITPERLPNVSPISKDIGVSDDRISRLSKCLSDTPERYDDLSCLIRIRFLRNRIACSLTNGVVTACQVPRIGMICAVWAFPQLGKNR